MRFEGERVRFEGERGLSYSSASGREGFNVLGHKRYIEGEGACFCWFESSSRTGQGRYTKTGLRDNHFYLISANYNIATKLHSKTVLCNHLRMCDVKNNISPPNYKIATASYSKTAL